MGIGGKGNRKSPIGAGFFCGSVADEGPRFTAEPAPFGFGSGRALSDSRMGH